MKVWEYEQLSDEEKLDLLITRKEDYVKKKYLNWGEARALNFLEIDIAHLKEKIRTQEEVK